MSKVPLYPVDARVTSEALVSRFDSGLRFEVSGLGCRDPVNEGARDQKVPVLSNKERNGRLDRLFSR